MADRPVGRRDRVRHRLSTVHAGAAYFHAGHGDARVPDLVGVTQHGVVYTGGTSKIAEHGGADPQDRGVPILLAGAGIHEHEVFGDRVETTQIGPTILRLLGISPNELQAARHEHTRPLPGL